MLVRPVADIASFPAPGWTTAPLYDVVDSVAPDDTTFITGLAPGAQDPQVALQLGDLEIPYGAKGQIIVRVRMRWSEALTEAADAVRIGLGDVADLGVTDPSLFFVRSIAAFSSTEFETFEITFDYTDFAGDSDAFGVYVEMTPNSADATVVGHISWIEVEVCTPAAIIGQCSLGTTTARAVIMEARDHHTTFEPRRHPNGALLRLLSSYQRQLTAKIARTNPALLAVPCTYTLPLADFDDGIELPNFQYIMPGIEARLATNTNVVETVELVNVTMRVDTELINRFVYLRGQRLYLSGNANLWNGFGSLTVNLVLTPKELTTLDDVLTLPDWGMDAYVGTLVQAMAIRSSLKDAALLTFAGDLETQFLDAVAQQRAAETSYTRDVFPGGW